MYRSLDCKYSLEISTSNFGNLEIYDVTNRLVMSIFGDLPKFSEVKKLPFVKKIKGCEMIRRLQKVNGKINILNLIYYDRTRLISFLIFYIR